MLNCGRLPVFRCRPPRRHLHRATMGAACRGRAILAKAMPVNPDDTRGVPYLDEGALLAERGAVAAILDGCSISSPVMYGAAAQKIHPREHRFCEGTIRAGQRIGFMPLHWFSPPVYVSAAKTGEPYAVSNVERAAAFLLDWKGHGGEQAWRLAVSTCMAALRDAAPAGDAKQTFEAAARSSGHLL